MDKWLNTEDMSVIHDISKESLDVFFFNNKGSVYTKKIGKSNYYNETELLNFYDIKKKKWNQCHENYYEIEIERKMVAYQQGLRVMEYSNVGTDSSWSGFFSYRLWHSPSELNLINLRTSKYIDAYYLWSCKELGINIPELKEDVFDGVPSGYPEVDLEGFNSVNDYYDFKEAERMLIQARKVFDRKVYKDEILEMVA